MKRTHTLALSVLMLLAVTAGSASAGALITSARIKDNTVASVDVRNQSLTGVDVRDGSLSTGDIRGLEEGPQGETGPPGAPGSNGAPGLIQRVAPRPLAAGQRQTWTSFCGAGETAISGGVSSNRPDLVTIERSAPDGFHWSVQVHNPSNVPVAAYAWALCVPR